MQGKITRIYDGLVVSRQIVKVNPAVRRVTVKLYRNNRANKLGWLFEVIPDSFVIIQIRQRRFFLVTDIIHSTTYAQCCILLINGTWIATHIKYLTGKCTLSHQTTPVTQVQRKLIIEGGAKGAVND